MRAESALISLMVLGSASVASFIVGRNYPVRRATDIPARAEVLEAMADEIGLDTAQRTKIREISDSYHDRLLALQKSVDPSLAAIRSEVRAETQSRLLISSLGGPPKDEDGDVVLGDHRADETVHDLEADLIGVLPPDGAAEEAEPILK